MMGYPGCACMDDLFTLLDFDPDHSDDMAQRRLRRRVTVLQERLAEARRLIRIAKHNYQAQADGFRAENNGPRMVAAQAMADLMGGAL
jgi:hypothetical protein